MYLFLTLHLLLGLLAGATLACLRWSQRGEPDCPKALSGTPVAKISLVAAMLFIILTLWGDLSYLGLQRTVYGALLIATGALLQGYVVHPKVGYYLTLMGLPLAIACVGVISKFWLLLA